MDATDRLCGEPGPGGMTCTRPSGHRERMHAFELSLPPSIASLLEQKMTDYEESKAKYERHRFWMVGLLGLASVINIVAALFAVFG